MVNTRVQRKGFSQWHTTSPIHKKAKIAKPKAKNTATDQPPDALVLTTQISEYLYEGHAELTVKPIGKATSSVKMSPVLCNVAYDDGDISVWFWQPNEGGDSVTAVFHNDIRMELIKIAGMKGSYVHEAECGSGPADITAFHEPHLNWWEDRSHRPDVLLKFAPPYDYSYSENDVGFLFFKGHVVIDFRNNPLKAYSMPLTFAPNVEGWRLEAIRRTDVRINLKDIEARVPVTLVESPNKAPLYKPTCDENALAARARRFRERNGGISWCTRDGSRAIRNFMHSLLSREAKDTNAALDRELSKAEMAQLRLLNLGKNPERARKLGRSAAESREVRSKYVKKTRALLNIKAIPGSDKEAVSDYEASPNYEAVSNSEVVSNGQAIFNREAVSTSEITSSHKAVFNHGDSVHHTTVHANHQANDNNAVSSLWYNTEDGSIYDSRDFTYQTPLNSPRGLVTTADYSNSSAESFATEYSIVSGESFTTGFSDTSAEHFASTESSVNKNKASISSTVVLAGDSPDPNSVASEIEDSRYAIPTTFSEAFEVTSALTPTTREFERLTGHYVFPKPEGYGCYMYQYNRLQQHFEYQVWPHFQGPSPKLPIRTAWTGGINNWRDSEVITPASINGSTVVMAANPLYFMSWVT